MVQYASVRQENVLVMIQHKVHYKLLIHICCGKCKSCLYNHYQLLFILNIWEEWIIMTNYGDTTM